MSSKDDSKPKQLSQHVLRVGPAGWSYADWAGYVYPAPRPKGFHEASYLAQFFDTIEINTSFYNPINPQHASLWLERVAPNPAFVFTSKLWQKFTHEPAATAGDEKAVRAGFDVLREAGKLGAVLLQFPFSFHRNNESHAHLGALLKRFADYPLVVELRHSSWQTSETLDFLAERKVGFCNIDQPVIGRSVEPSDDVTSPIGYVRLHGRRHDTWFSEDPDLPPHERYNYMYSAAELDPWVARIKSIDQKAQQTYVISNNHYQGKAIVNALEILSAVTGEKVNVPDPLRQQYAQLEEIARGMPETPTLFPMGTPTEKRVRKRSTSPK